MRYNLTLLCSLTLLASTSFVRADTNKVTDTKVDALLQKVWMATTKAKSLTADVIVTHRFDKDTQRWHGKASLLKPNFARIEMKRDCPPESGRFIPDLSIADGELLWSLWRLGDKTQYTKRWVSPDGANIHPNLAINSFFRRWQTNSGHKWVFIGQCVIDGKKFQAVQFSTIGLKTTLYIGKDGLVNRTTREELYNKQTSFVETVELRNICTNINLIKDDFKFQLPPHAILWKPKMR